MKKLYLLLLVLGMGSQIALAETVIDRTDFGIINFSTSINSVEAPPALFDGYKETKWLSANGDPLSWMTYEFQSGRSYAINSYAITSANDASGRDPKSWTLEGSNDGGTTWIEVDHRTDVTWSARFERQVFKFTNTVAYKMYKLQITANYGEPFTQFSELELIQDGISRTAYSNVTWSSQYNWNEGGLRAFDNMAVEGNFTKWGTGGNNITGWLQYDFLGGRAYALNGYTITSANDAPERDPRDWTFQGSFDGVTWEILDTQAGQFWQDGAEDNRYTPKTYTFDNNVAYSYYKLDITQNNGSGNLLSLAELELLERTLDGSATYVAPAEAAVEVETDAVLDWTAGSDAGIQGHYVWMGTSPDAMVLQNDTILPLATTEYDPDITTDTTYFWQVEEVLKTDGVNNNDAGDPNNIWGRVSSFTTKTSVVTFNPDYPEDAFAFPGEEVSFEIKAADPLGGEISYQWFIDGDGNPDTNSETALVDGADYDGVNTDTLIVKNGTPGYYRCGATNTSGKTTYSDYAQLYLKQKMAHWTMDSADYDGANYIDISGNGVNAVTDGTPTFVDGLVDDDMDASNAVVEGAIEVMDPNSTASAGAFNPSEETNRFSVSAWVKRQDNAEDVAYNVIAAKRDGWATPEESYWGFMALSNGALRTQANSHGSFDTGAGLVTIDEWHHVVLTFNGTHGRMYVDGMLEAVSAFTLANGPESTFRIGRNDSLTERFEGSIDDMQVFNFDLSAEEVVDIYFGETGTPTCIYGNPAADINGDCDVNLLDIAEVAGEWLDHGFYPDRP